MPCDNKKSGVQSAKLASQKRHILFMLKLNPKKTLVCSIAIASIVVCGVVGIFTFYRQNQTRNNNINLRKAVEALDRYSLFLGAAEVSYLRYLGSSKDIDLRSHLKSVVQAEAMLRLLHQYLPDRSADLSILQSLSSQKIEKLAAAIKEGVNNNRLTLETDRASSEVINSQVGKLKTSLNTEILTNIQGYNSYASLNWFLLIVGWINSFVIVVIFVFARIDYLKEQRLRLEEVERELLRDRTLNKAKDEARSQTISFLRHDFNNILTGMLTSLELLERQELPKTLRRYVERIRAGSVGLRDYIEDIQIALSCNQTMSDRDLQLSEFDLIELARDSLTSPAVLRYSTDKHLFELKTNGNPRLIRADRRLIERSLINLISNAAKYSPQGGAVVVCLNFIPSLTIEIADEGNGIPGNLLPNLFSPFQRGDNVGEIQGTGLGLAFVRSVAIAHGGTIEAFSVASCACSDRFYSTVFKLSLPETR